MVTEILPKAQASARQLPIEAHIPSVLTATVVMATQQVQVPITPAHHLQATTEAAVPTIPEAVAAVLRHPLLRIVEVEATEVVEVQAEAMAEEEAAVEVATEGEDDFCFQMRKS